MLSRPPPPPISLPIVAHLLNRLVNDSFVIQKKKKFKRIIPIESKNVIHKTFKAQTGGSLDTKDQTVPKSIIIAKRLPQKYHQN